MTTIKQTQWLAACNKEDLVENVGVTVLLNGKQIALFYLPENDSVLAVDNFCPFSEANIISRGIVGDLKGKIVVASPLYKQHFCLITGICIEDENVKLATFDTRFDGTQIKISLSE